MDCTSQTLFMEESIPNLTDLTFMLSIRDITGNLYT